jgi:ribosomal protein S12 methylthiotransferase
VDEIQQLVAQGVKEVVLIAQDLTSYGRDLPEKKGLLGLLKEIEEIEGLEWYRLMYNYPKFFTDELIDWLAQSKKFCRYIDMPLQHVSDPVLKQMKRPESSQEIIDLVGKLRERIPNLSLRTTLMVGFPGETDEDFEKLLRFVEDTQFDHMGAFTYFPEKGTPSAEFPNQIPDDIKQDRYAKLMSLQQKIQENRLKALGDLEIEVRIDANNGRTKRKFQYLGRHSGQAPEIDGITYIECATELAVGSLVRGRVKKIVAPYDLLVQVA